MRDAETVLKVCTKCDTAKELDSFCKDEGYKDGRRSDCNECRQANRRGSEQPPVMSVPHVTLTPTPYVTAMLAQDLPDPERLPAAYLKRCSDYWTDLVGGDEPTMRIA